MKVQSRQFRPESVVSKTSPVTGVAFLYSCCHAIRVIIKGQVLGCLCGKGKATAVERQCCVDAASGFFVCCGAPPCSGWECVKCEKFEREREKGGERERERGETEDGKAKERRGEEKKKTSN